jgi:hypothetical protein
MGSRWLKLRRADVCVACGGGVQAGIMAWWDAAQRTVTCKPCHERATGEEPAGRVQPDLDRGWPGASAGREHGRRKDNREERTRKKHPRIGGLLLALCEAPQSEKAFHQGEIGEQKVGVFLEECAVDGPAVVLHDRKMPGGHGNIDHVAVAPTGVFVIDAKAIKGKVGVQTPLFGKAKLRVRGRDRTNLIDGLDRQVAAIRGALEAGGYQEVPVQGVLCFTDADLPLVGGKEVRGHLLLYRKGLRKRLQKQGPISSEAMSAIAEALATTLPSA